MMFPIVLEAVNGLRSGMLTGKLDDRGDLGYYRMIEFDADNSGIRQRQYARKEKQGR